MSLADFYTDGAHSDYFGAPRGGGRTHRGDDVSHSTNPGTVWVPALLAGEVVEILSPADWHGFGHQVKVRSGWNGRTIDISYSHGDSRSPYGVGDWVEQGAGVITEGNTGATSGSCVHIEIYDGGFVNPWPIIQAIVGNGGGGGVGGWNLTDRSTEDIQRLVGANPDNVHGPETDGKIKAWQAANRLDADGIWGDISDAVGFPIDVDGNPGIRTFAKLQHRVGAAIDGEDGPDTTSHLQAALGVPVDGGRGPVTITAWQKAVGANPDGIEGADTWAKTQAFLNTGAPFPNIGTPPVEEVAGGNVTSRPIADIQRAVGAPITSVWDRTTYDAVVAWQRALRLDADGIWGNGSDGIAFPPAGSIHGADYSFARPDPAELYAAGFRHVGRYLWPNSKGLTRSEYDALRAAGLDVWLIYEEDGKELLGGHAAGVTVAKKAEQLRTQLGLGEQPIYFNVDFDATAEQLPAILEALKGIASVVGIERTGLYAGYGPIKAAFDAGLIEWGFQTYAWSGGKWDARAQLQQWSNGQWGGSVDFTRAMTAEYGQRPVTPTEPILHVEVPRVDLEALSVDLKVMRDQIAGWLG